MSKKFFLIIILAALLCGCGESNMHKYAEKLDDIPVKYFEAQDLYGQYAVEDDALTLYLKSVKNIITGFRDDPAFSCLNWKAFDTINTAYAIDVEKIQDLSEAEKNFDAVYLRKLRGIAVLVDPAMSNDVHMLTRVTHELCHALLECNNGDQKKEAFIIEGEVDLLTFTLLGRLGITADIVYPYGVYAACLINDVLKTDNNNAPKEAYRAIINGKLGEIFDEAAGAGAYEKMNIGGALAETGSDFKLGINAMSECLCHFCRARGKASLGEKWISSIKNDAPALDVSYMKKILSQ